MQEFFELLLEGLFDVRVEKRRTSRLLKWVIRGFQVLILTFFFCLAGLIGFLGIREGKFLFLPLALLVLVLPMKFAMKWLRK